MQRSYARRGALFSVFNGCVRLVSLCGAVLIMTEKALELNLPDLRVSEDLPFAVKDFHDAPLCWSQRTRIVARLSVHAARN